jgi:antitoxin component of MazEF toxin-antitoxin module
LPECGICYYGNYVVKTLELKLTRIGNSRGIRIPARLLRSYGFSGMIAVEAQEGGLLLKTKMGAKLTWEETAREMAASGENWPEWDATLADGLDNCPWDDALPNAAPRPGKPAAPRKSAR